MIFFNLLNNIALLVSLSILHSLIIRRWRQGTLTYQLLSGLLFGSVGVVGMMNPLRLMPGIIFDGRSIIISTGGFIGGPLTGAVTGALCASYRLGLGGSGTLMGLSVITASACIGILYHFLRRRRPSIAHPLHLLGMGVLVHIVMLLLTLTLPQAVSGLVLSQIAVPVLVLYPVATVLVCMLFLEQESHIRAETALRYSEEKYRELVENASSVILRLNPQGQITFMNGFGLRLFGFSEQDLLGKHVMETIVPTTDGEGRDPAHLIRATLLRPEDHPINEHENICSDGRRVWIRWTNKGIRNASGHLREILSVGQDITDQKLSESARRNLEEQLEQSRKLEAVGMLAGGVAHDLNNLLSPILGYSDMILLDNALAKEHRDEVEQILRASERARDLVRRLMAFGRKQSLDVQPVDLNAVILGFLDLLRRTLHEDIRIERDLDSALWTVRADRGQLEQVLMNLAINAQDAMPGGGVISIETRNAHLDPAAPGPETSSGPFVRLTVRDTGLGIEPEVRARIFEPFFTTKVFGKGYGLGLATVYGIVKQHGGSIAVESVLNEGSAFTVFLPAEDQPQPHREGDAAEARILTGAESILVAEDYPPVRKITVAMLRKLGYPVVGEGLPSECLKIAQDTRQNVDLLITDVVMPEMSGQELYARLRAIRPGIRVLFMSGHVPNVIHAKGGLEEGAGFIQKPFTQQELGEKLRQVLSAQVR